MAECRAVRERIGPYVYGDVSEAERAAVESHLLHCPACRNEVAELRRLAAAIPKDVFEPDQAAVSRVLQGLEGARAAERRRPRRRPLLAPAVSLAVVAAFALGLWIGSGLPHARSLPAADAGAPPSPSAPVVAAVEREGDAAANESAGVARKQQEPHPSPDRAAAPGRARPRPGPERRPPQPVQLVQVAPGPVFAPPIVGIDDVTRTSPARN